MSRRTARTPSVFLRLLAASLFVSLAPGCNDTPSPATPTPASHSWDPQAKTLTFPLENVDGSDSPFLLRATDITWAPDSGILSAQVAVQNIGVEALVGPTGIEVFDFVPSDITPLNAVCGIVPGPCFYEYDGAYGEDGVLEPRETSEAREWQIYNARGQGFRFRSRLLGTPDPGGRVAGVVYEDRNFNGQRDINEPGLPGIGVSFKDADRPGIVLTDDRGRFELRVEQPGVYTVLVYAVEGMVPTTATDMQVVVFRRPDGSLSDFLHVDFGFARRPLPGPGVGGIVFLDGNRDGLRQSSEPGVPGVRISVTAFPPDVRAQEPCALQPLIVSTDANGAWFVSMGDVACALPWLIQRAPIDTSDPVGFPMPLFGTTRRDVVVHGLPMPGDRIQVDFGVAPFDTSDTQPVLVVEGVVFLDTDANGVRDPNEPPASGVRLELLSPCDRLETSWANHRGFYRFEPPMTDWCPIGGVAVSTAWQVTTQNPVLFPPPTTPGIHVIHANFGVLPQDVAFPQ